MIDKNSKQVKERMYEACKRWRKINQLSLMYSRARSRAKKKGIDFTITKEDVVIPYYCPLLGVPLVNKYEDPAVSRDHVPSIDRLDSTKGYTPDNIWVISFQANRMKNTASREELNTFCKNWLKYYEDI